MWFDSYLSVHRLVTNDEGEERVTKSAACGEPSMLPHPRKNQIEKLPGISAGAGVRAEGNLDKSTRLNDTPDFILDDRHWIRGQPISPIQSIWTFPDLAAKYPAPFIKFQYEILMPPAIPEFHYGYLAFDSTGVWGNHLDNLHSITNKPLCM